MAKRAAKRAGAWTADQAKAVLHAWTESGQSAVAFGRSIGVVPQRLFGWRRRLAEAEARRAGNRPAFAAVAVRTAEPVALSGPIVVTLPTGVRIEVGEVDATTAAWVVAVLSGEARA